MRMLELWAAPVCNKSMTGLWTRRREFESPPGYQTLECNLYDFAEGFAQFPSFFVLLSLAGVLEF